MRRKIKELMNKEEGFTLVELLAVIVILGIIVAIAIPAIGSVIDRAGDDADSAEHALVVDAARLYVTTTTETLDFTGDGANIKVNDLIEKGYLEIRDSDTYTESDAVNVKKDGEKYIYTYESYNATTDGGES